MEAYPIVLIDDDSDDLNLVQEALQTLNIPNEIITFSDGFEFLNYIKGNENRAFLIICDINMGRFNGLELKRLIQDDLKLRLKCVPFVFLSTSNAPPSVLEAYSHAAQGYFIKPTNFSDLMEMLQSIIGYWSRSQHPPVTRANKL